MTRLLWAAAVALYAVGDLATTWVGLRLGAVEQHPAAAHAIADAGLWILLPWKLAGLSLFAIAYAALARRGVRSRVGIPLGLVGMGAALVANNVRVLAAIAGGGA